MSEPLPTKEEVERVLRYVPSTGKFYWLNCQQVAFNGHEAGSVNSNGYVQIKLNKVAHKAHRLAVLCMTGVWPTSYVDHINKVTWDNRWSNLRVATQSQNMANSSTRTDNTTGLKGLSWHEHSKMWLVQVRATPKIHRSYHKCMLEAVSTLYRQRKLVQGSFADHE